MFNKTLLLLKNHEVRNGRKNDKIAEENELEQEGATYGPRRSIFRFWINTFDLNLAREPEIKSQFGPLMKIVAHLWAKA